LIPRKKKQDRRSYSCSDLFGSLSLVDNTDGCWEQINLARRSVFQ
jgi:hypothetical protein